MRAPLHLMDDTVDIERPIRTLDIEGSPKQTWAPHLSAVRCRIQPLSATERLADPLSMAAITHRVYMPGDTDVSEGDRLRRGSVYYDIIGVRDYDLRGAILELTCQETR